MAKSNVRIHFVEGDSQNFMRIRRAKFFLPERGVIPISGKNCAGKTSFARALAALVGGDGQVEEEPRNRDAPDDEPPYVIGRLSNGTTIKRAITGAASTPKGRLTATDSEGRHLTQTHLTAILGVRAINPMEFFGKLKPHEQRDVLLGFAPALRDTLEQLNTEKEEVTEERRPHKPEVRRLDRAKEPEGVRHDPGDVGRFDDEGYLYYVKRKAEKELIKPGGENVYPAEVEKVIMEMAGVKAVCVFGVPDVEWGEAITAVVEVDNPDSRTAQEVIDHVAGRIARFKKPRWVEFTETLPKSDSGETDRDAVKERWGKSD